MLKEFRSKICATSVTFTLHFLTQLVYGYIKIVETIYLLIALVICKYIVKYWGFILKSELLL